MKTREWTIKFIKDEFSEMTGPPIFTTDNIRVREVIGDQDEIKNTLRELWEFVGSDDAFELRDHGRDLAKKVRRALDE